MKKITLILIVLLAAVALIGPGLSGKYIESQHEKMISDFNQQYPMYKTSYQQLESSWFSSSYKYQVKLDMAGIQDNPELAEALNFDSELSYYHGPLPFAAIGTDAPFYPSAGTFSWDFDYAEAMSALMEGNDPDAAKFIEQLPKLSGHGWMQYNSNVTGTATQPATTVTLDEASFELGELNASFTSNVNNRSSDSSGSLPTLIVKVPDEDLDINMADLAFDLKSQITTNGLPLINGSVSIGETEYTAPDDSGKVAGFSYGFYGSQIGEKVSTGLTLTLDGFQNEELQLGKASMTFGGKDMNEASLAKLYNEYQSTIASIYQDPENFDEDQLMENLQTYALELVRNKPTLITDINYQIDGEQADVNASFDINAATNEQLANINSFEQFMSLLPVLYGEVKANIPAAVAENIIGLSMGSMGVDPATLSPEQREQMIQQSLTMPLAMGYLTEQSDADGNKVYRSEAFLKDGKIMLNGQEIPLGALLQ